MKSLLYLLIGIGSCISMNPSTPPSPPPPLEPPYLPPINPPYPPPAPPKTQVIDYTDLIKLKKIKNFINNVPTSPPPLPPQTIFEFDGVFDNIKKQIVLVIGLNKLFDSQIDMDTTLNYPTPPSAPPPSAPKIRNIKMKS